MADMHPYYIKLRKEEDHLMEEKKVLHEAQNEKVSGGSAGVTAAECKFCGSSNIDFRRKRKSDGSLVLECRCYSCGKTWEAPVR